MSIDNYIEEIYKQYGISSNQFFVALQKLYNNLCNEYWGEDITQFKEFNGHINEYKAINVAFEKEELADREWKAFRGVWKHANEIKHSSEEISFSQAYAILCVENYNSIVRELLNDGQSDDFIISKKKLIASEEKTDNAIAEALNKAQREAELKAMQLEREKNKRKNDHICPLCGSRLVERTNRKNGSKFWGCPNYSITGCRGTEPYLNPEEEESSLRLQSIYDSATQWFIAREREKGGNVRFIQNIGLPYPTVNRISTDEDKFDEYKRFSHWRFDYEENKRKEVTREVNFVTALGYKMLTRGKVTCVSPFIEKKLEDRFGKKTLSNPEVLVNYYKENDNPYFWLDGMGAEMHFYKDVFKKVYGRNYERYVIPQIDLATLVGAKENLGNQRVDFAICDGKNKIAIELDDYMHHGHEEYDRARNQLLTDAGFKVFRIPNASAKAGSELVDDLANSLDKCFVNPTEMESDKAFIACKIIQQIEVVTLYGLMHGYFSCDEDIAVNLNTEVFSNDEIIYIREIAAKDINEFLGKISKLYSIDIDFNLQYINKPVQQQVLGGYKEISYDTHAKATENRIIVSDFVYSRDFINNLPSYDELGKFCDDKEIVEYFMRYFFRKDSFREGQFRAISNTLHHKDSVVLLPTGHGKSIAFQLSSLLTPGISMVISPLVSLMYDQVDNLRQYGIDRVKALTGGLSKEDKEEMSELMISGDSIITYISPERLQIQSFRETLERTLGDVPIPLFVIDEAHCLSEWGHTFRTSYLNLGRIIREHCRHNNKEPIIMALTGTASDNVLSDIRNQLGIWEKGSLISPTRFDRKELHYQVVTCANGEKREKLREILENMPLMFGEDRDEFYALDGENISSGLVFCAHVNGQYGVYDVCNFLKRSYKCDMYSGAKPSNWRGNISWDEQKTRAARKFKNNECNIFVATSAYGMGIDKPNIRFTVHYNIAKSIEAFYQETGRAGRDRKDSECILLTSLKDKDENGQDDFDRIEFFHNKAFKGVEEELENVRWLMADIDTTKKHVQNICIGTREGDTEQHLTAMEKAIYRLLLIGVISDYKKIRKDEYSLDVNAFDIELIRASFQDCIRKYHEGRLESEMKKFDNIDADSNLEYIISVEEILIKFIYDNIVKSRRQAMLSMKTLAESAASVDNQDTYMHTEIENYLTTDNQRKIQKIIQGQMGGLKEARDFYEKGDFQNLSSLRGQLTRQIESFPDHPGLVLSRAYIDLVNNNANTDDDAIEEMKFGIECALDRYSISKPDVYEHISWILINVCKTNKQVALDACKRLPNVFKASEKFDLAISMKAEDSELVPFAYKFFAEASNEVLELIKK